MMEIFEPSGHRESDPLWFRYGAMEAALTQESPTSDGVLSPVHMTLCPVTEWGGRVDACPPPPAANPDPDLDSDHIEAWLAQLECAEPTRLIGEVMRKLLADRDRLAGLVGAR